VGENVLVKEGPSEDVAFGQRSEWSEERVRDIFGGSRFL
jgi:hypothetical protein